MSDFHRELFYRELSPRHIAIYLRDAQPTDGDIQRDGRAEVEALRVKATKALHCLYRQWRAEVAMVSDRRLAWPQEIEALRLLREHWITTLDAPPDFDRELQDFFDHLGRVIFTSSDPLGTMMAHWTEKPKRGAPRRNVTRDFYLAVGIQELVNEGRTVDEACGDVFESLDSTTEELDPRTLRNIYFAQTKGKKNKLWVRGLAAWRTSRKQQDWRTSEKR
jgi:hypothetical protein